MIQTIISQINKSQKLHAIYEIVHRALISVQVTIKKLKIAHFLLAHLHQSFVVFLGTCC